MDEPSQAVDRTTLRQMFNEGNYWDRALYGDLHQAPVADDTSSASGQASRHAHIVN
jgi:hypothetical protein